MRLIWLLAKIGKENHLLVHFLFILFITDSHSSQCLYLGERHPHACSLVLANSQRGPYNPNFTKLGHAGFPVHGTQVAILPRTVDLSFPVWFPHWGSRYVFAFFIKTLFDSAIQISISTFERKNCSKHPLIVCDDYSSCATMKSICRHQNKNLTLETIRHLHVTLASIYFAGTHFK